MSKENNIDKRYRDDSLYDGFKDSRIEFMTIDRLNGDLSKKGNSCNNRSKEMDIKTPKNVKLLKDYLMMYQNDNNSVRIGTYRIKFKTSHLNEHNDVVEILNFCDDAQIIIPDPKKNGFEMLSDEGKKLLAIL